MRIEVGETCWGKEMSKVDWSKAPDWATGHGRCGHRNFWISEKQYASVTRPDKITRCTGLFKSASFTNIVNRAVDRQWPSESRIDIIGTNGNTAEHYMDEALHQTARVHYETLAEKAAREKAQVKPQNKYDREIIGKYGSGKCIVDVYRVLVAFGDIPPEIQHAIKKLLAGGKRGHKDEGLDYLEAIQSIEAYLNRLDDSSDQCK